MKRIIQLCLITAALILPSAVFADGSGTPDLSELGNSVIPYVQLDLMCSMGSFSDEELRAEMRGYSAQLDPFYKNILMDRYDQNPWGVAALNICTGGMGSLLNGNYISGSVLQAGTIASYTFMVLGLTAQEPEARNRYFLIAEIGAVAFGVAGIVLPFIETGIHNKTLRESLSL